MAAYYKISHISEETYLLECLKNALILQSPQKIELKLQQGSGISEITSIKTESAA